KAAKTEITSYTSGDAKWYFYPVPVTAGQQYEFLDYYVSDISSYVTVQVNMSDGTNKYIDIAVAEPSETWHGLYGTFVAPQGAVSAAVFHMIKGVGYLIVDDYSLKEVVPDPDNIVYNGSLETQNYNGTKPDGWNTNRYGSNTAVFSYKSGYGINGSKGAKVEVTDYVSGDAKWYSPEINVSGGEEYLFSDYYMSSASSNTTIQFRMSDGTFSYIGLMNYVPSSKWKKAESSFIVPEGAAAMILFHTIKGNGYLITDNYSVKKLPSGKFSEGMVTFNFDDGFYSIYENALPILDAAGIKSSQYLVSGFFTDSFYVNPEETMNMFNAGHEIGSHTINHVRLTDLSEEEMRNEIFTSKAEIEAVGVPAVKTFVYPFGAFNDDVRQAVIDAGYIGARSVFAGYNTKNSDKFSLKDQHVESDVTVEQIKSYIDRAVADRTWLILELHATDYTGDKYSNTPETLQAVVDYLIQNNVKVVTTEEGIALMGQ
ncbi:MAG: polysaccharide deacetylase family protein, partial [Candidatus Paceibacter sp.]|nr:polysaccharide deacetylase family protein [Candidatus Paceibacter sp.]